MRTVWTLTFVLLFVATAAFAQNDADIDQTGNGNAATADQTGTNNDADVMQNGDTNTADIDQFGTNIADIQQTGNGNTGAITQGESGTPVTNSGPNNPGNWQYGAFIDQIGNDNIADIAMWRSSNGASIYQEGDANEAYQILGSSQHKTTDPANMGMDIDQIGNNNYASQEGVPSFGVFGIQGIDILQVGNSNTAVQYSKGGAYSTMEVVQEGDGNGHEVDVSTTSLDPLGMAWADKPAGDYTQYQNAYRGTAITSVLGNNNQTTQYQEYTVWAAGGDNDAWIDIIGDDNNVAQGQLGEYNDADVDLIGSGNVVATMQLGDSNMADIDVINSGNNNILGISQAGDMHTATILVDGMSNVSNIIQQP